MIAQPLDNPKPITVLTIPYWIRSTLSGAKGGRASRCQVSVGSHLRRYIRPNLDEALFIVGAPRSGTTFLGSCFARLPEFSYHYEPVLTKAASRYVYNQLWSYQRARLTYRATYSWLMRLRGNPAARLVEKTPRNSFVIPFLARAFPRSKFIIIVRDGRDAAISLSKGPWYLHANVNSGQREDSGYLNGPYPRYWVESHRRREFCLVSDIRRSAWVWRRHNEEALAAIAKLPSFRVLAVRYESLVNAPACEARRLLEFSEIPHHKSCQAFIATAGTARKDSVGRWRYELNSRELREIEEEAGGMLDHFGYGD